MKNKRLLVLGCGKIGVRKAKTFLKQGANVIAVSRSFHGDFETLEAENLLKKRQRVEEFLKEEKDWLREFDYGIIATSDKDANDKAYVLLKEAGIEVLRADKKEDCDFIMSSVARKEGIQIAISTGGASPTVAKYIRSKVEALLDDIDMEKFKCIEEIRKILVENTPQDEKKNIPKIIEGILNKDSEEVRAFLEDLKEKYIEDSSRN